jgi:hypothetical protein
MQRNTQFGAELAQPGEKYHRIIFVKRNVPFPIVIDVEEAAGSLVADAPVEEKTEEADYHRLGPILANGKPAEHRAITPKEIKDEHIKKSDYERGPGRYFEGQGTGR